MLTDLKTRGAWTSIQDDDGHKVEGWLVGEVPEGVLLAMDEELHDIRLVRNVSLQMYDYQRALPGLRYENADALNDQLRQTGKAVSAPMRRAIANIKFDRLHDFGHRGSELRRAIVEWRNGPLPSDRSDRAELMAYLAAQADRSTALHRNVYETLDSSGVTPILAEFGPQLAKLPPELTIPAYDLEFESRRDLAGSVEATRDLPWSPERHNGALNSAEATRDRLMFATAEARSPERAGPVERPDDSTPFSRWFGPSLRVLAGTGLAAANAAVGVTAGLTGSVVTLGATAVPTYVAVITSMYTGLAQVAEGLEKIGRRR